MNADPGRTEAPGVTRWPPFGTPYVHGNIFEWLDQNGERAGFASRFDMTVIPEPAAALLVGLGLAGLAALRRALPLGTFS